ACVLRGVLCDGPVTALMARAIELIEGPATSTDPTRVARTLQFAISAFLGIDSPVGSICDASQDEHELVTGLALATLAQATGDTASTPADEGAPRAYRNVDEAIAAEATTIGRVQDLCRNLVAATMPTAHAAIEQHHAAPRAARVSIERTHLGGATRGEIAAYLLAVGGMPLAVIDAVGCHEAEDLSEISSVLRSARARS
ncbi:MAG: hypothetical protein NT062_19295, partial [Proteobacteria bacterium]|nr:hypothetical protein [Pseudomonadota bacterium]